MLNNYYLIYNTVKYVSFQQLFYRIYYFVKRRLYSEKFEKILILKKNKFNKNLKFRIPDIRHYKGNQVIQKIFEFLNIKINLASVDNLGGKFFNTGTRLWKMNFYYHEYFIDLARQDDNKTFDFIEEYYKEQRELFSVINSETIKDCWNSYTVSLRILSWCKIVLLSRVNLSKEFVDLLQRDIFKQAIFLKKNLEFDLKGNHYLTNLIALIHVAYLYNDQEIYIFAKSKFIGELNEQILPDGAHFELSPMYHQTMLFRVLDTFNLVANNDSFNNELEQILGIKAELMLGWLQQITFSNDDIPLVNDSAFGVSPKTSELLEYGSRLGLHPKIVSLNESGYRKFNGDKFEMVADVGHIGPDYIPGHAHSDTFNFVLYKEGSPFIVDTGTSTYNAGERRDIERQTSSHNTVKIGEYEQSETWSSFRVARRVKPVVLIDSLTHLSAKINYVTTDASHQRDFTFSEKEILISDKVDSKAKAESYIHFHPDVEFSIERNIVKCGSSLLTFSGAKSIESESFLYAPMFNTLVASKRIVIEFEDRLDLSIVL